MLFPVVDDSEGFRAQVSIWRVGGSLQAAAARWLSLSSLTNTPSPGPRGCARICHPHHGMISMIA